MTSPIRAVKDASEIEALRLAGAAADRVAAVLQAGAIGLVGSTEAEVSARIGALLIDEGHSRSTSPSWAAAPMPPVPTTSRAPVIGRARRWCVTSAVPTRSTATSATARTSPGPWSPVPYRRGRSLLPGSAGGPACRGGVRPVRRHGRACRPVAADHRRCRLRRLFVHRTGHGIGIEEHEDPYLVVGNDECLDRTRLFGGAGIYLPDRFGMRLEDIVVIGDDGEPEPLNSADHDLVVVDGRAPWTWASQAGWNWWSPGPAAGRATADALAGEGAG